MPTRFTAILAIQNLSFFLVQKPVTVHIYAREFYFLLKVVQKEGTTVFP